ncbi:MULTISPECIES: cation:proton antiporter [Cyanophyceae]|uniref:Cation:proton antiporter n=1 Tax=Stenomitos frigidus AS-A4 TaxID=2933935 RepID=A0ABV0KT33_9CYAN|nr:sodium:proton antiporter [Phormidium sp. FACHB-592]
MSTTVMVGIGAQVLARWLQIPGIVLLLLFGIILGSSGLGLLEPSLLGSGLEVIVSLAIALILFEGGLNLQTRDLSSVSVSLRNLVTVGMLVTFSGGAIAAHALNQFSWAIAFLYASLVVVTGPTVVTPLLKLVGVEQRVATLLEGEGILIDPLGAIVAVITLTIVLSQHEVPLVLVGTAIPLLLLKGLGLRLGIGTAIGLIGGVLLSLLLRQSKSLPQELKNLVVLAAVWGAFSLAQALRSESGLLVAVLMGLILRASAIPEERLIRQFNEQLGILANSVLFILLAADLSIASILDLGWGGVLTVLTLMLIVRPINILLSTWNRRFSWKQQFFLSWIAPRGIVAASMASLFALSLTKAGIAGGEAMKALVFLTILMTVLIQGLTAGWVARCLGLQKTQVRTVIVGNTQLSQLLAQLLQQQGEAVALIDLNATAANPVQVDDIPVISKHLDLEELEAEGIASLSTFLALTNSPELNGILAQRALELFRPERVATLAQPSLHHGDRPSFAAMGIKVAFAAQVSLDRWNQSLTKKDVKLVEVVLQSEEFTAQQAELQACIAAGDLLPLLLNRADQLQIMLVDEPWQTGDRITFLLDKASSSKIPTLSQSHSTLLLLPDQALPEQILLQTT